MKTTRRVVCEGADDGCVKAAKIVVCEGAEEGSVKAASDAVASHRIARIHIGLLRSIESLNRYLVTICAQH